LDGREIVIKTKPGQIIQCETTDEESGRTLPYITMVKEEGMPSHGNPFVKGNLYIAFHVKFPKTLDANVISAIRKLLPEPNMEEDYDPEEVEEHYMEEAQLKHFGKGGAVSSNNEYDSDDEGGPQPVQCQQS
jgi:DnaJ homolog subfamily A member 2